jgi:hypothetical protein
MTQGELSQGQSVMLTTKLSQEPGILTQASSNKHELKKNVRCGVLSCSKKNLPVRKYLFKKIKKEKKYGTKIRLHQAGYQQLDSGRSQHSEKFLLDDVFYRSNKNYGREQNRNFVPDRISPGAGDGSLDSQTIHPSCKKMDQKIDRLRNQCWGKIYGKIYEPMDENFQVQNPGQNARKIESIKISLSWIRGHWPRIFLLQLELRQIVAGAISRKRQDKQQASSVKRQASSVKHPDSGFKQQASSAKLI